MPVLVGFRAFRPASSFVSLDTDASPQSSTFHTRETLAPSIMKDTAQFKITAKNYLKARQDFLTIAEKTDWLFGNDNLVGRIGEFIAYQYLHEHNRDPKRPKSKTEKGFDFLCNKGTIRVSVKTITSENKVGSTTIITEPWDELILITINSKIKVEKFGFITKEQFQKAKEEGHLKSQAPYARRSMVGTNGLFSKFGKIVDEEITNNYL